MRGIAHMVSVSGGKDSTATYLLAMEYAERHDFDFVPVFADTGNEHPITLDYVRNLPRKTGGPAIIWVRADFSERIKNKRLFIARDCRHGRNKKGRKIRWSNKAKRRALAALHPTGNPFLDLCMWKGRFPSRRAQFCTEELKVFPIMEQVVMPLLTDNRRVLSWQGVRGEESLPRSKQPRFENQGGGYWIWRPIHRWSVQDVFDMHRRHGVSPNPLYRQGMGRVGCMPCINCKKREILEISYRFPDHIERISTWETIASLTSKRGASTFFHKTADVGILPINEIFEKARVHQTIEWAKTARGGKQYDLIAHAETSGAPACKSAYGLCE